MLSPNRCASLACLAILLAACSAPRDERDDSTPPKADGGGGDGGKTDGGAVDGGLFCEPFKADCNHDETDGCETDVLTSSDHCGRCDNPCNGTCADGTCHTGAPSIELCTYDGATFLGCATPPNSLAIDFGKPATGTLATRTLEVRSSGEGTLQVEGPAFTGNPDFSGTPNPFSVTLAPNQKAAMGLTFGALASGHRTGALILSTNVPGAETISIDLSGGDAAGTCQLEAVSKIDFGNIGVLVTSTQTLMVQNTGTVDCVIPTEPDFLNGFGGLYEVVPVSAPLTVTPGAIASFSLKYTPQDSTGPDTATLRVKYAAVGSSQKQLTVALTGAPVVNPECILEATPAADASGVRQLEFGGVVPNSTNTLDVMFTNHGSIACTVSNPRISTFFGSAAAFSLPATATQQIQPNGSATFTVKFVPTAKGEFGSAVSDPFYGVVLAIDTTDSVRFTGSSCSTGFTTGSPGCVGWALHGSAVDASLVAIPDSLNFGTVTTNCQSPSTDVALLAGATNIEIKSIRIDPVTTPVVFSLIAPATPFSLAAGTTKKLPIRFRPAAAKSYSASLIIESSMGILTVPLSGSGTSTTRWSETLLAQAKSDVLFMIDDSASMDAKQTWLSSAIPSFLSVATSLSADYQIAIVTTDMDDAARSGNFVGSPKVITSSTSPSPLSALQSRVQVGINGSGTEMGLGAVMAALSPPLINDAQKNGGFLRSDANLAVVVISDEEDQSTGAQDSYVQFLKSLKGKRSVALHAIVGDPAPSLNSAGGNGCTVSTANGAVDADAGNRYLYVQSQTGGLFRSICSANWSSYLADIANSAFAVPRSFLLARPATAGSFTVKVNGGTVSSSTYSFDSSANAITFNAASAPAAGSAVTVDYDPVCQP